jgi:hypothetical protein
LISLAINILISTILGVSAALIINYVNIIDGSSNARISILKVGPTGVDATAIINCTKI